MLDWRSLDPFGATVDADLSQPLDEAEQRRLRDLLWDRQILIFTNQKLSHERQAEIIDIFEPVHRTSDGMHFVSTAADKGGWGRDEEERGEGKEWDGRCWNRGSRYRKKK